MSRGADDEQDDSGEYPYPLPPPHPQPSSSASSQTPHHPFAHTYSNTRENVDGGRRQSTASNRSFHAQILRRASAAAAGQGQQPINEDVSPSSTHSARFPAAATFPHLHHEQGGEEDDDDNDDSPPSPAVGSQYRGRSWSRGGYSDYGDYEEDLSPKSVAAPSLRRPTIPDITEDFEGDTMDHDYPQHIIGDEEEEEGEEERPEEARVTTSRRPTDPSPASLTLPPRPPLLTATSSSPLLGDISGQNSPTTPATPRDPFLDASVNPSPVSSASSSPDGAPPKIHINSIPNSPATPNEYPTFENQPSFPDDASPALPVTTINHVPYKHSLPTFSSPFNRRQSSLANIRNSPIGRLQDNHTSPTASFSSAAGRTSAHDIHHIDSIINNVPTPKPAGKTTIAERRSQRMRHVSGGKDRKGRDGGKEGKDGNGKTGASMNRRPFQSTRLKGEIYKPWLEQRDPAQRWARWITIACIIIGFAVAGIICYDGYASVPSLGKICPVINDNFANGIDKSIWQHEIRLDGYDHGRFDWTTDSSNNSYVKDGVLYLVPTLTSDIIGTDAVTNGYTLNLTTDGTCTSTNVSQCVAVSNSSRLSVINPVRSARLITKTTASIQYGKVEVKARFPTGDWLWPSITMLPVNETYGKWPRSGQIDILTGRGNNMSYPNRGVDYAQSDLHWGPSTLLDRLYLTWGYREQRRTYYNQQYHTFGLEWNDKFMWTYIDSKVSQVMSLRFNKQSFWERGKFPNTITNSTTGDITKLTNTWIASEHNVAPFDQPFYLILDLGVGGTDGWFPDGEGGKPWLDDGGTAMSDFWAAREKWWDHSWPKSAEQRGFAIQSVKMWKTC